LAGRLASALLLVAGPGVFAAGPDTDPARRLEAVVPVQAEIPAEALTASLLGTRHDGSGVVIDDARLIVTIRGLITEAMAAEVTTLQAGPAAPIPVLKRELGIDKFRIKSYVSAICKGDESGSRASWIEADHDETPSRLVSSAGPKESANLSLLA
jgi:hypothetical protein